MFRRSLAVLSIVALTTAGVAGSAAAGGYHYGYGSYKYKHYHSHKHYHRHKGGNTAGKVLLGVGAGLLFLSVLNAANKPRDPYYRGYSVPAEPPRYVPRPGPSSTRRTRCGWPMLCHTAAHQSPISSPNIWLTSGAVTKSPPAPMGRPRR